nr:MAG TPA: hypothetical protein [Caudoviricetes sp.]DAV08091.1 MAG TPA: hypothetical protein [Caudoviricetes sp.]
MLIESDNILITKLLIKLCNIHTLLYFYSRIYY